MTMLAAKTIPTMNNISISDVKNSVSKDILSIFTKLLDPNTTIKQI